MWSSRVGMQSDHTRRRRDQPQKQGKEEEDKLGRGAFEDAAEVSESASRIKGRRRWEVMWKWTTVSKKEKEEEKQTAVLRWTEFAIQCSFDWKNEEKFRRQPKRRSTPPAKHTQVLYTIQCMAYMARCTKMRMLLKYWTILSLSLSLVKRESGKRR